MASSEPARLASGLRARRASRLYGIYAILNEGGSDPAALARDATRAGIRVLQYRAKHGIVAGTLRALRDVANQSGALLIVNDDADAALRFDCDGVHLGPGDRGFDDIAHVRAAAGDRLIGVSCGTLDEARAANVEDVDYLGVGSVFATPSKADAGDQIGIERLRRIAAASRFPVAAIGGIDERRLAEVARCGVAMAAVISAISAARDPAEAAKRLVRAWEAAMR
jgi:thiamine-phosphate pyrophosphorylase